MKHPKLLLPVLILALLFACPVKAKAAAYAEKSCGENASWKIEGTTLIISGSGAVTSSPWYTYYRYDFNKVVISEGITSLHAECFKHCSNVRQVTLPASLNSVGADCFADCKYMTTVNYNGTLTQWKQIAFQDTSSPLFQTELICTDGTHNLCGADLYWTLDSDGTLRITGSGPMSDFNLAPWSDRYASIQSVVIEEGVTTIGNFAFYNQDPIRPYAMTQISLPKSLVRVGYMAFCDCTLLTDVYFADTYARWIRMEVAGGNEMLQSITLHCTDVTRNMCGQATYWELDSQGTLTIMGEGPTANWNGYTRPPWHTKRYSVKKTVVSEGVTRIGNRAFDGNQLEEILLPKSVVSIGEYAFTNSNIVQISFSSALDYLGEGAFEKCIKLKTITIPDKVTTLGKFTFRNCSALESAYMGSGLTVIGEEAFAGCTALKEITLADSITTIDACAFLNCRSLPEITLPKQLEIVEGGAFQDCTSLAEIILLDKVTTVGYQAFRNCVSLTQLNIPASMESFHTGAVMGCSGLTAFRVDKQNPYYASDSAGVLFNKDMTVLLKAPQALAGSYRIPETITELPDQAFSGCSKMTHVTIPDSVTRLPSYAFYDCTSLKTVTLSKNLTCIGSFAFTNCQSLTQIQLPESLTIIEMQAFYNCTSLKTINLHDHITYIGSEAFCFCCNLENFVWPAGVSTIQQYTFAYCYALTEIDIPNTVTAIEYGAFYQCSNVTRFTIPAGVTEFDPNTLSYCCKLSDLRVDPDNPKYMSDSRGVLFTKDRSTLLYAPCGLAGTYEIPEGTITVASLAFSQCNNLTAITIPATVTTMESNAIYYNQNLQTIRVAEKNSNYASDNSGVLYNKDKTLLITAPDKLSGHYTVPDTVRRIEQQAFRFTGVTSIFMPVSLNEIGWAAFAETPLKQISYAGTATQWGKLLIGDGNDCLRKCTIHYNRVASETYSYDLNNDGILDVEDAVYLLLHSMFGEAFYPLNHASADVDGSGAVDQNDAVYLLLHVMFGDVFYPLNAVA